MLNNFAIVAAARPQITADPKVARYYAPVADQTNITWTTDQVSVI